MTKRTLSSEFRDVDATETANHLVQYLEFTDSLPETRQIKVNSYRYLNLKVADAGGQFTFARMMFVVEGRK
ncbi:MAG: hypothetical protein M0Q91_08380 [Methanoregula sp.]|jgi:hypothetical protein|nr:hypothetical protein [Methanoregula sp.]